MCPAGLSHATGHTVGMGAQQQGQGWAEHLDEPPVNPRPAARGKVGMEFRVAVWAGERGAIGTHAKQKRLKGLSRPRGGSGREKGKGLGQTWTSGRSACQRMQGTGTSWRGREEAGVLCGAGVHMGQGPRALLRMPCGARDASPGRASGRYQQQRAGQIWGAGGLVGARQGCCATGLV